MLPKFFALTAVVIALAPAPARAQEAVPQEAPQVAEPAPEPVRQAVPRGSRPQGDNPRIGTAVPRVAPEPAAPPEGGVSRSRGRTVVVRPPTYRYRQYWPYPEYNRFSTYPYSSPYYPYAYNSYPYAFNSFGFGYLYHDPYASYSSGVRQPFSSFDIGELRLDVSPRHAHVYVDGYFAGVVDDYDGPFQGIKLAPGAYRVEIVAPGYETLTFDVRITPSQKIRYQGELLRRR